MEMEMASPQSQNQVRVAPKPPQPPPYPQRRLGSDILLSPNTPSTGRQSDGDWPTFMTQTRYSSGQATPRDWVNTMATRVSSGAPTPKMEDLRRVLESSSPSGMDAKGLKSRSSHLFAAPKPPLPPSAKRHSGGFEEDQIPPTPRSSRRRANNKEIIWGVGTSSAPTNSSASQIQFKAPEQEPTMPHTPRSRKRGTRNVWGESAGGFENTTQNASWKRSTSQRSDGKSFFAPVQKTAAPARRQNFVYPSRQQGHPQHTSTTQSRLDLPPCSQTSSFGGPEGNFGQAKMTTEAQGATQGNPILGRSAGGFQEKGAFQSNHGFSAKNSYSGEGGGGFGRSGVGGGFNQGGGGYSHGSGTFRQGASNIGAGNFRQGGGAGGGAGEFGQGGVGGRG
eukprot:1365513-Amorphochlora_amoeboformis.AAC.2